MRLLWHRLNESSDTRLNRIRRLGYFRFCALYAVIFPAGHLVAGVVRAASTGADAGVVANPLALAGWSATGAAVASVFWLAAARRAPDSGHHRVIRPCRAASTRPDRS